MMSDTPRIYLDPDDLTLDTMEAVASIAVKRGLRPEKTGMYEDAWFIQYDAVDVDVTDASDHLPPPTQGRETMVYPRDDSSLDECCVLIKFHTGAWQDDRLIFTYLIEFD
jgi:hypothetical protein